MTGAYPGFLSMKHAKDYFCCPLDGMLVHHRVNPPPGMEFAHFCLESGMVFEGTTGV